MINDRKETWPLVQETMRAFAPFYRESMQQAIQAWDLPDRWFGLALALGSDPAPFTPDRYYAMFPYATREQFSEALENLAKLELLERVGEDAYRLTGSGRRAVEEVFGAAHLALSEVEPLPTDEMVRLNRLLWRIVEATLKAPEPREKWALTYSRGTDPGDEAAGAVKTDQLLTDLVRYRDDAHLAAWQPYDVTGHAWEVLTLVWRGEAETAEALAEQLEYRPYTVEDYEETLQALVERGWLTEEDDRYRTTDEGQHIRDEAEEATDRYFFVGWSALNDEEQAQLSDLLTRLKDRLQEMAGGGEVPSDEDST